MSPNEVNRDPDYELLLQQNNYRVDENFMSRYLYNMPGKLSWSEAKSLRKLNVFWRSDQLGTNSSSGRNQTLSPSLPAASVEEDEDIKERIRTALQRFESWTGWPLLAQFWGPTTVGGQLLLSASHLPFGLVRGETGLCRYRKECLHHKYIIDDGHNGNNESRFVPPERVFRSGCPEIRVCVESYSIQHYPLRDFAMLCGVKSYWALPVFDESRGQKRCVGVLEVVVSIDLREFSLFEIYASVSAIKDGGLRTSDIFLINDLPFYVEQITRATNELEEGLKMVCEAHNLPFAQIWGFGGIGIANIWRVPLLSSINIFYRQNGKYLSFLNACQQSYLWSKEGVVGKAYSYHDRACFCKDVTQLSKDEYSLALAAREVNLTCCFAIPLDYDEYQMSLIVEIFLPNAKTTCIELRTILGSLLGTIRHHFRSFKVANGLQKGWELHVEVIRLSEDDGLDDFTICETPDSLPRACWSQNEEQNMQGGVDVTTVGGDGVCPGQFSVALAGTDEIPPNVGGEMQLCPPHQSLSIDHANAVQDGEENVCGPEQTDTVIAPLDEGVAETPNRRHKITKEVAKTFNRRRSRGRKITKEDLEQLNGRMKIDDAAKFFDVSRSTFKRRCKELEIDWKYVRRKEPNNSLSMTNTKRHVADDCVGDEPHSISTPYEGTTSDSYPTPQATTMQHGSSIMIKAKYRGDMVKFRLSLSSTLVELMGEITKRYKLQFDTFKVKYQDEYGDSISLTCDDDLHECMNTMRSLGRAVVSIRVIKENMK